MNLKSEFEKALTLEEYLPILGEQQKLHQLHYNRAEVDDYAQMDLPELKILVITEPWCGDSTAILPVLQKFFENKKPEIRIALRDENPELMDLFLTNGGRAIPVVVVLDEEGNYLFHFGPRPQAAQRIFENHRRSIQEGKMEKVEVIKKIRQFYSRDRGKAILKEFLKRLAATGKLNETIGEL